MRLLDARHRGDRDARRRPWRARGEGLGGRPRCLGRGVARRRVGRRTSAATRCSRLRPRWAAARRPSWGSCRWSSTRSTTATTSTPAGRTSGCRSSAARGASSGRSPRVSTSACRAWCGAMEQATTASRSRLEDGGRSTAPAAVVALPLNVWRDVAFDPPLAGGKAAAPSGRAIPADRRSSSRSPATCPMGSPEAAGARRSTRSCRWATSQAGALLAGFSPVPPLDPADRAAVTDAVRAFIADAEVVAHGGHDWNADRFSRGVWFAEPPGWHGTIERRGPRGAGRSPCVRGRRHPADRCGLDRGRRRERRTRAALRIRELLA